MKLAAKWPAEIVAKFFPPASLPGIEAHLPLVLAALEERSLTEDALVAVALGTIAAFLAQMVEDFEAAQSHLRILVSEVA